MKINLLLSLSFLLLINSVLAREPDRNEPTQSPTNKWGPQLPPPPLQMDATFKKTVEEYMQALQKQDYKATFRYEDWEGGPPSSLEDYQQTFSRDFKLKSWQITQAKSIPEEKDRYLVLVLITHNPPKEIAAMIPQGMTVRSTLRQWWQKKGDKFVHLFNIEKKELANLGMPPNVKDALATPSTAKK